MYVTILLSGGQPLTTIVTVGQKSASRPVNVTVSYIAGPGITVIIQNPPANHAHLDGSRISGRGGGGGGGKGVCLK